MSKIEVVRGPSEGGGREILGPPLKQERRDGVCTYLVQGCVGGSGTLPLRSCAAKRRETLVRALKWSEAVDQVLSLGVSGRPCARGRSNKTGGTEIYERGPTGE